MKLYLILGAIILSLGFLLFEFLDRILYKEVEHIDYLRFKTPNLFDLREDQCSNDKLSEIDFPKNPKYLFLCKTSIDKFCLTRSPAEEQKNFYVIAPIYSLNQNMNTKLADLHTNFKHYCEALGVKYVQVEYIIESQDYLMTKPGMEPIDIQLKGEHLFYLRENLVNVAEKKLPEDYEYISWIDAHIYFEDPYIFQKMIVSLGKSNIVSPISHIYFKSKTNRTENTLEYSYTYVAYYHNSTPIYKRGFHLDQKFIFPYYGLAYATKKSIFRAIGGVPDLCIAGSCDVMMGHATTGYDEKITSEQPYAKWTYDWVINAGKVFDRKIDYIGTNMFHFDHYWQMRRLSSWGSALEIMKLRKYDPFKDMKRDENGTLYFVNNFELAYDFWKLYSSI